MKKVVLYGELGKKFGKYWNLDVNSPAEAVRAIGINKPEFQEYLLTAHEKGLAFKVFAGKEDLKEETLTNPVSSKDVIRIVPVIMGAGGGNGGLITFIIGAIIFVVSFFVPAMYGWGHKLGAQLMIAGAVSMLIQHFNKPKSPEEQENPENKPSFSFGGAVNTITQGGCVPVCYGGPIEVGSYVISGSVDSRDIPL